MIDPQFLITALIVVLVPGTGVMYTVSTGLFLGWKKSIGAAIGCTIGIVPHLLASVLGLSAILHMSALAFVCVKYAGALYLMFLAWSMWRETGLVNFNRPESKKGFYQTALRGFLINILNPKLSIFFLAFLPLFIHPESTNPMFDLFVLSLIFMTMTLVIFILYGVAANGVRQYFITSPKLIIWLQRTFAAAFAALGAKLAMTEIN